MANPRVRFWASQGLVQGVVEDAQGQALCSLFNARTACQIATFCSCALERLGRPRVVELVGLECARDLPYGDESCA